MVGQMTTSFLQADATTLLIGWLQSPDHGNYGSYGYDVYLPNLIRMYLTKNGIQHDQFEQKLRTMMPALYAAAWDLCRRGVLRPGIHSYNAQATADGASGNGYSFTPFGRQWLAESNKDSFVPTEPERFAEMLSPFKDLFGPAFHERAQEAIRCYGAHAYLACCGMCGAAAESVLLATAIEKADEVTVLTQYNRSSGRKHVENLIFGKSRQELQKEYSGYSTLLKYWRDQASHGHTSRIQDNEAYTSLALLLRYVHFSKDNWSELTQ